MSVRKRPLAVPRATSRLNEAENVPLYLRVAQSLRNRINSGEWAPDTQLPIIKQLAEEYDVALVTIRLAFRLLAADNLIVSQRGRGTFVNAQSKNLESNAALRQAINDRVNLPPDCTIKVVERYVVRELPPSKLPSTAKQRAQYQVIDKLHLDDGTPFAFISMYVDKAIYDRFPRKSDEKFKIFKLILDLGQLHLSRSTIQIALAFADDRLAKLLDCAPLSALVRIRTIRCDTDGFIVMGTDAYYRGDKFLYEIIEEDVELSGTNPVVIPNIKPDPGP
jgi:GntR family transcriptional regulator